MIAPAAGRFVGLLALLSVPAVACPVRAQAPARPKLESGADTNDWQAYYAKGASIIRQGPAFAEPYFHWASRLEPSRPEPLFAAWVTYWMRHTKLLEQLYLGRGRIADSPDALRADSLRLAALLRSPFVNQSLELLIYEQMGGYWSSDPVTRAWIRYFNGDYVKAADILGSAIAGEPSKRLLLRYDRALVLVAAGRLDSATTELRALLDEWRERDQARLQRVYESKELFEYGLGLLLAARNDPVAAREAFGRALAENLAFASPHQALGRLSMVARDTAGAVLEHGQAVELRPDDAVYRQQFGEALLLAGRAAEATAQFRRAIAIEPLYADPYYGVAAALDVSGDLPAAAAAYRVFLLRAARRPSPMRQWAERRAAAIQAANAAR